MFSKRVTVIFSLIFSACMDSHAPDPTGVLADDLIHSIRFNHHAVTLAVGDTVRIKTQGFYLNGNSFDIPPHSVVWSAVVGGGAVLLTPDGGVIGQAPSGSGFFRVIGSWTHNDVTRSDTLRVVVTDSVYDIERVSVFPLDSNRGGISVINPFEGMTQFKVGAWGKFDNFLEDITNFKLDIVRRPGHNQAVGLFPLGSGGIHGLMNLGGYTDVGWIRLSALIFGKEYIDSAEFEGLYPASITIQFNQVLNSNFISKVENYTYIQPCGKVRFINSTNTSVKIVFDKEISGVRCASLLPQNGDVFIQPGQYIDRVISVLGRLEWKGLNAETEEPIRGLSGVITVAEREH